MELALMGEELWNVHLRRTSVPLTASISEDVYIRIPLTRSTPANTQTHTAQRRSLLQKPNAEHTEQNQYLDKCVKEQKYNAADTV